MIEAVYGVGGLLYTARPAKAALGMGRPREHEAMSSKTATYKPTENEPYMSKKQLKYFKEKLIAWKEEILQGNRETITGMQENVAPIPDLVDRASSEADRALELRTRDRERKLINKIEAALRRIEGAVHVHGIHVGLPDHGDHFMEDRELGVTGVSERPAHERAGGEVEHKGGGGQRKGEAASGRHRTIIGTPPV